MKINSIEQNLWKNIVEFSDDYWWLQDLGKMYRVPRKLVDENMLWKVEMDKKIKFWKDISNGSTFNTKKKFQIKI